MVCVGMGDTQLAQDPSSRLQWHESCLIEHHWEPVTFPPSHALPAATGLQTYSCILNKYVSFLCTIFSWATPERKLHILVLDCTASMPKSSPPQAVNAAIVLPVGRVTLFFTRVAAKVMQNATHFRNQPGLCNATLPPPNNLGLCQPRVKTSLEAKGGKIKAKQQHGF